MTKNKTDITIQTYDKIVDEYIAYFKTVDLKGCVQFQREIDYIVAQLPDDAMILDVGTAIGDYPKYLTEQLDNNFHVVGIDTSKNMIQRAKLNAPLAEFQIMDARQINFPVKFFDAIICFATLIHVNDKDAISIIDKFDAILKNGGLLAINVMEQKPQEEKETFIDEPFNTKYKTYFNRYTKDFFRKLFAENGYKILSEFDNGVFNPDIITEVSDDVNQFSIIAQKL